MPAVVLATAIGIGCGGKQREREWIRIGPPSCVTTNSTHVQVLDEQQQPLASVAVHVEVGEQAQIMTSDPRGVFELAGDISDDKITAPGYEIVSTSRTSSCHAGPVLVLVLRPSSPPSPPPSLPQ